MPSWVRAMTSRSGKTRSARSAIRFTRSGLSIIRPSMGPASVAAARRPGDQIEQSEQDQGAADGDEPGLEVEEVLQPADVERRREEAAEQGAEDADGGGA